MGDDVNSGLVGRRDERAALDAFVESAAMQAGALLLQGPRGIGKTTLWKYAIAHADAKGFAVHTASPAPGEQALPLAVLIDLFGIEEEWPQRRLRGARRDLDPLTAAATAVRDRLEHLAARQPVLIAVDDVHQADEASLTVLAYALHRLQDAPIAFVGVLAPVDGLGSSFEAFSSAVGAQTLAIPSLDPMSFELVLQRTLEGASLPRLPRGALAAIDVLSGGCIDTARAIAQGIPDVAAQWRDDLPPLPPQLADEALAHVSGLDGEAVDLLRAAAAMRRATASVIIAATGVGDEVLAGAVEAGVLAQHGEHIRFTNRRVAAALYWQLPVAARREMHGRLADLVQEAEERAHHQALAAPGPAEPLAAHLEAVARQAAVRGARGDAAWFAEAAVRLTPSRHAPASAARLRLAAGERMAAGDTVQARRLTERAAAGATSTRERVAALITLGRLRACTDDCAAAQQVLALAHVELRDSGGSVHATAAVERELAWVEFLQGRAPLPSPGVGGEDGDAHVPAHARPETVTALRGIGRGEIDEARALLASMERECAVTGDDFSAAFVLTLLSEVECLAGRWRHAEAYADEALVLAEATGQGVVRARALYVEALLCAYRGEFAQASAWAESARATADRTGAQHVSGLSRGVLALVALARAQPHEATRHLEPLIAAADARTTTEAAELWWVPGAAEALSRVDRVREAADLLTRYETLAQPGSSAQRLAAARARATVEATAGRRAVEPLSQAVAEEQGAPPFERARAQFLLGGLLRVHRQPVLARGALSAALEAFEVLGASGWAELVRRELTGLLGRTGRSFTSVEQRIVDLVLTGLTTREIAAQLFISPRTVESHLTAVYRKAGVRGRAELAYHLAEQAVS